MDASWSVVIDFTLLSLFLGIATYLKRSIGFFQKYIIPTSIIAGFIGLILGPEVLNIVSLDIERLGNIVYHLMAIGFIALALKDRKRDRNKEVTKTGAFIVSTYIVQGIIGLGLSLLLVYTLYPNLFPPFGLLLPLGYGQGPGQAYSIGTQWEELGFSNGGNIGLTIATLGFLWACIIGILLINFLTRRKQVYTIHESKSKEIKKIYEESEQGDIPLSGSIDKISIQIFLIGIVYLATYLTLKGLSIVLVPLGVFGETLSQLLWGFHFIIGTIYAILLRIIFDFQKKRGKMTNNYPNNYLLQRISGGAFDFMITASISAISIYTFNEYVVPILLITTIGGIATIFYIVFMCKKVFKNHVLEYIVALYGMLTGTISTGLALLKEVDPNFETNVAENLVLGSAVGLFLGVPLMLILNIPIFAYVSNQPQMYAYTFLAFIGYLGGIYMFVLRKK